MQRGADANLQKQYLQPTEHSAGGQQFDPQRLKTCRWTTSRLELHS